MSTIHMIEKGMTCVPAEHAVGWLFECAPDASFRARGGRSYGIAELLGPVERLKEDANALACKLLDREPPLRGMQQLGIFRERVIAEIQNALALQHLDRVLRQDGITHIRFGPDSQLAAGLASLQDHQPTGHKLAVEAASRTGAHQAGLNGLRRLREAGFTAAALTDELLTALNRIDPYRRWRRILSRRGSWSKGEIWFYTTAYTFTAAGLLYEPYFPEPFRYLVENRRTGGRALSAHDRPGIDLYQFARPSMIPARSETAAAREVIESHLRSVALTPREALARDQLLESAFAAQFWARLLPQGLFSASLFEAWAEETEPKALVTGNYVFEGYAMQTAQRRRIPCITLQHGLFIDYCQYITPAADRFIVRGRFWRDFLPREAAAKALVLNPPERRSSKAGPSSAQRTAFMFLTAPYVLPFWNDIEIDEILAVVLDCAEAAGAELILRVHPMETVAAYEGRVRRLRPEGHVRVTFSQGAGLDEALARSRLVITYFSTVFQDCLRHGVPIVALGWHDFAPKTLMQRHRIFHFADSLTELRQLVTAGLAGQLRSAAGIEPFLATSRPEDIREAILTALHLHQPQLELKASQ